jgi:CheY-like chemotaxis protein
LNPVTKLWPVAARTPTILLVDDDPFHSQVRTAALQSAYPCVVRAAGAAEAFILADAPEFARDMALVIVGLNMPGLSGPAFVAELANRIADVPILVLCRQGECGHDYLEENVHLLPAVSPMNEMLYTVRGILAAPVSQIA